ncbi:MAG TPA: LysM peptidoglycan-binding domain-containing protein [Dehalococcoidia bacterium]
MLRRLALAAVLLTVPAAALAACGGDGQDRRLDLPSVELQDPRTAPTATPPAALPTAVRAVSVTPRALVGDATPEPAQTQTPSGTPGATATPSPAGRRTYRVKEGDTLAGIARQFGVSYEALCRANGIDPNNPRFFVDQELIIPEE